MTSRLIVNSIRHTGASTDSISLSSDGNTTFNATGSMVLPSGTTAQRPGSPSEGMYRYNTTIKANELYNGNAWVTIGQETVDVHYLVIGGGGSGGGDWRGGGGGAGAFRSSYGTQGGGTAQADQLSLAKYVTHSVIIGAGGAGVAGQKGNDGTSSTFSSIVSKGGGTGGKYAVSGTSADDGNPSADPGGGSGGGGGGGNQTGQGGASGTYGYDGGNGAGSSPQCGGGGGGAAGAGVVGG